MAEVRTGGCQCGAVRFRATALVDNAHVCHCRMCQKAVGGFFAALVGVPKTDLTWTRGAPAVFESSDGYERGFCAACGTPLFYHDKAGAHVSLCIAAFDRPATIPLTFEAGLEARLPQIDQLGRMDSTSTTEGSMPEAACAIAASNHQHPDHDTADWPR
ncbi:MAG: GFA family protein [Limimaricola sp.]|uniref:GFA family protein n=1 Tax=Limimaricola sp. TaxID=2211665 RepID=UPI001D310AA7|nr:GFA family protein [Limimaricola sp.]MBI1418285.1 GFA family protein [Limimaricola sp.]